MQFKLNLINTTLEKTIDNEQDYNKLKDSLSKLENELHLLNEQLKASGFKSDSLIELNLSLPETQDYCTDLAQCIKLLKTQMNDFPKESTLLMALYITTFNTIGGITEGEWLTVCENFFSYIPAVVKNMNLAPEYEEVLKQRITNFLNTNIKVLIHIIPQRDVSDEETLRTIKEIFLDCKENYRQIIENERSNREEEEYADLVDFFEGDKTKVC